MKDLSDSLLWNALKEGDLKAFSVLFENYYPLLHNYGLKISNNATITEDSLQDFFLYVYEHRENLSSLETIAPYLFTSYKRFLLKIMKKKSKTISIDFFEETLVDIQFTPEEVLTHQEISVFRNKNIAHLLNKLSRRQKEAIYLKYYCDLKTKEISEVMAINYQSVVNAIHKALKNLREELTILKLFN